MSCWIYFPSSARGHIFVVSNQRLFLFHHTSRFEENLCLATREDDPNWTSFVYWTAQSLVYAEENNISQSTSHLMPLVHCFGEDLQRMFRDAVHAMGNYKEVYDRNLADILPRGGRNMLNLVEENLPFRYIPPGLPF